ncbi:hypothetical protein [uncultured Treponema sp.]|uniref:hypothetical protein n=1 Tax=uncultured Treponema sp. TaxID=162155 RepID=UPI0026000734|nr:hypothetical protein [uncultured Treponema sp.]
MKKTIFALIPAVFLLMSCDNQIASTEADSSGSSSGTSTTTWKSGTSGTSTSTGTSTSETSTSGTGSSSSSGTTTTSSNAATFTYSEDSKIFEISSSLSSVTIAGLSSGKTLYLTKTNPTSTAISSSYTRYISSATGLSLSNGDSEAESSGTSSSSSSGHSRPNRNCTSLSLNLALPQVEESSSRAASTISQVTPILYSQSDVGSASRSIYIDQDSNISTFKAETATLRALGENCYVWVVSDNWSSSSASGEKINSQIAGNIAANFDAMYDKIRNVFGKESDNLSTNTSLSSQVSMENYSETGTKVNIVIYDIGKDFSNGSNSGDVVGYFYAKDYFALSSSSSVYKYSNKGKYFYVDGYYAVNYTSTVYSTLAHEFQHMIDFGVKSMEKGLVSSTAWNEMKSMLCEDIMHGSLEELDPDFSEDDAPVSRLPMFNRHYADVGLEYKSSSPEVYYSYSNNYAFGAWLVRNYGGISLLHEIATNSYIDEKAIIAALKTLNENAQSMEELLKAYTVACVISDEDTGFQKSPTDEDCTLNEYSYSLSKIDLWNLASLLPESYSECKNSTSYYKFDGPLLYGYNKQQELRPYGITLQKIGSATSEAVTINFNTSGISTSQKVYVVVE